MFRGSSPIFDVPEFPPLRRVKPLPKRRRTSGEAMTMPDGTTQYSDAATLPADGGGSAPVDMASFGLNMPLPQYYMPMFTGVQDMFRMGGQEDPSLEYPGGFAVPVGATEEEEHGDGDYVDHLQQPGNTKKRKVPAAHHHHHRAAAEGLSSPILLEHEALDEHVSGRTGVGAEATEVVPVLTGSAATAPPPAPPSLLLAAKKNRSSAATLAGLQHKELLKTRKRQLAAVLGALSHGDTLALDQALSAKYTSAASLNRGGGKENEADDKPRRRWGRRRALIGTPPAEGALTAPTREFTFACPSPTSDRLISTREEVAVLHSRFEAELSRQAAKAAEVAKQNALAAESGTTAKGGSREQQRTRGANTNSEGLNGKTRSVKKKKRSALANASNPHHLRNYVPSRVPHSGQAPPGNPPSAGNVHNQVSAPAVRFLSAEIAPRRRKKSTAAVPTAPLNQPEDEWICALCEYNLFYGEEAAFRRAVRSRKKILVRRRRARERAAAAASGQKTGAGRTEKGTAETAEVPGDGESAVGDGQRPVKHGKERDKHA